MANDQSLVNEIRRELGDPGSNPSRAFEIARKISRVINDNDDEATGRELVIRALDRKDIFEKLPGVVDAFARHVGLFPYADALSLSNRDQLAYEYHRPIAPIEADGEEIVFHRAQAEIYRELINRKSVILSAPTSFGKSLLIDSLVATNELSTIVMIVPTIALIDETRRRLGKFRDQYKIITHASQVRRKKSIFVLTQERAIARDDIDDIDLLVIDEFYKLDPANEKESPRNIALNQAFYKLSRRAKQLYMLGPSIDKIPDGFEEKFGCTFRNTNFSTVVSQIHKVASLPTRYAALVRLCQKLTEPTLIYCRSQPQAYRVAAKLVEAGIGREHPLLKQAANWIGKEYHPEWSFVSSLGQGVGLHHGGIPRALAQFNVGLFNAQILPFLICTSTLIEGVNTAAKNVIIFENKIATRKLDFFTFNNIRGRSGRMFKHFIGNVYIFDQAPQEKIGEVDVPAFSQGEATPLGLLLHIDRDDLSARSKARIADVEHQKVLSLDTIRQHSSIDPRDLIKLAAAIKKNASLWHDAMAWTTFPHWSQLKFVCTLIFDYFVKKRKDGISSGTQLAFRLNRMRRSKTLHHLIETIIADDRYAGGSPDTAVRIALEFHRRWAIFQFPRLLLALDAVQKEIFSRMDIPAGNYSGYAAAVECTFASPELMGLDEYGLPIQLGVKLSDKLKLGRGMDAAIDSLRLLKPRELQLSGFERAVLSRVQSDL